MRICNYCSTPLHTSEGLSEPYLDVCVSCMSVLENQKNRPEEYEHCVKCQATRYEHMNEIEYESIWGKKIDHEFVSEYA